MIQEKERTQKRHKNGSAWNFPKEWKALTKPGAGETIASGIKVIAVSGAGGCACALIGAGTDMLVKYILSVI